MNFLEMVGGLTILILSLLGLVLIVNVLVRSL